MSKPECLVFADGDDWIVFAPRSRLLMRTNQAAARQFVALEDAGPTADEQQPEPAFEPVHVSVACTNTCAQQCVYCYGTPAHADSSTLDLDFCRAGLDFAATNAARRQTRLRVHFHGLGEPTHDWRTFTGATALARQVASQRGCGLHINLCTGGQLGPNKADWVVEHMDAVQISIDGPAELHNRQRPIGRDQDALARPLALAQQLAAANRPLTIKATVTSLSVQRMSEIVEFVAGEIGPVKLDFGMVFDLPWSRDPAIHAPRWQDFVAGFRQALQRGRELGVTVSHPSISLAGLLASSRRASLHYCLAPPDRVTAFFDTPNEGAGPPGNGCYGHFDRQRKALVFDAARIRALQRRLMPEKCTTCICQNSCFSASGVKGRMPRSDEQEQALCHARRGVVQELLRAAAPAPRQENRP